GIFKVEDIRGADHKYASAPRQYAIRIRQPFGKSGAVIIAAVTVGIREARDPAELRRRTTFRGIGISAILDHVTVKTLVKGKRHWIYHKWLGSDQVDPHSRLRLKL